MQKRKGYDLVAYLLGYRIREIKVCALNACFSDLFITLSTAEQFSRGVNEKVTYAFMAW